MRRFLVFAATLVLAAGFAACSEKPWRTKNISGLMPDLEFQLTATDGRKVSAADYHGKVVLLFFGYTHCPDVCPTTLAKLSAAIRRLNRPDDARILFVTVDPARDTPAALRAYTQSFGSQFTGLRGERSALDRLTKRYRVTYGYGAPDANGDYEVSHSSGVFVFDRKGEARLLMRESDSMDAMVSDLNRIVAG